MCVCRLGSTTLLLMDDVQDDPGTDISGLATCRLPLTLAHALWTPKTLRKQIRNQYRLR